MWFMNGTHMPVMHKCDIMIYEYICIYGKHMCDMNDWETVCNELVISTCVTYRHENKQET